MPTNTLTSLAILKVTVDQGRDYLDYLRPFVLQILVDHDQISITAVDVRNNIRQRFGLEIPERTVEIVLKRISRRHSIRKSGGHYITTGDLPDPHIAAKQANAQRHIDSVLHGLREFSQETTNPIDSDEKAITAICAFLAEFGITCLRAYLRGTAIPTVGEEQKSIIVLVSNYIQYIERVEPERFNSFIVLVQGHMLANALLCPDLRNAPRTYRDVIFYLDTPMLVRLLGSEGHARQSAITELITLLKQLDGRVAVFSHSRQELVNVLQGAANFLDSNEGRGGIVLEARKRGTTRSDLLLLAESVDDKLREAGIEVYETPRYIEQLQIDETVFERVLIDEVWYHNPRAREYDINSVRSIYVIRGDRPAPSVEKARAVFVTTNLAFAQAAWDYGQQHESSQDVSSVIADFTLANMAWLKAPMGAPNIPTTQLLAFSYAALRPSNELLIKYLNEIDKLESQNMLNERDHQILRSSPLVYDELMGLTLGDIDALTDETIYHTLERVSAEIKREEMEKLSSEEEAHRETMDDLDKLRVHNEGIQRATYWQCHRLASRFATAVYVLVGFLLIVDFIVGIIFLVSGAVLVSVVALPVIVSVGIITVVSRLGGITVRDMRQRVQDWFLAQLLKRMTSVTGMDLSDVSN